MCIWACRSKTRPYTRSNLTNFVSRPIDIVTAVVKTCLLSIGDFSVDKKLSYRRRIARPYVSRKSCCYVFISYILVMLAQFCAILLFYGHLSVQELLPCCCSSMSEINWNWNWNSRTPVVKCWTPNPQQTEIMDIKCWGQLACSELCVQWVSCIDGSTTVVSVIRYDTIRYEMLV